MGFGSAGIVNLDSTELKNGWSLGSAASRLDIGPLFYRSGTIKAYLFQPAHRSTREMRGWSGGAKFKRGAPLSTFAALHLFGSPQYSFKVLPR